MKYFFITLLYIFLGSNLFAMTPFSLEMLKEVNVTFLDKQKLLTEHHAKALEKVIEEKLLSLGIKTSSKRFSNFLVKIEATKTSKAPLYHLTLSLVENVTLGRDKPLGAIAITYTKDELFESQELFIDTKESLLFLLEEFGEQYTEENQK